MRSPGSRMVAAGIACLLPGVGIVHGDFAESLVHGGDPVPVLVYSQAIGGAQGRLHDRVVAHRHAQAGRGLLFGPQLGPRFQQDVRGDPILLRIADLLPGDASTQAPVAGLATGDDRDIDLSLADSPTGIADERLLENAELREDRPGRRSADSVREQSGGVGVRPQSTGYVDALGTGEEGGAIHCRGRSPGGVGHKVAGFAGLRGVLTALLHRRCRHQYGCVSRNVPAVSCLSDHDLVLWNDAWYRSRYWQSSYMRDRARTATRANPIVSITV